MSTGPPVPGTLAEWLLKATQLLADHDIGSPRVDAQRLAAYALDLRWTDLWVRLRSPVDDDSREAMNQLLSRRAAGEPLAYILGSAEFFDHVLEVGPGVLVPRPETEALVEVALRLLEQTSNPRVVDIGTGSGAVAIAIASARPDAQVWATELSSAAADYAARNIESTGAGVRLVVGDLFSPLPVSTGASFDLVVSNPPYVCPAEVDLLDPDVLAEPHDALFAGSQGDEALLRIAREAGSWMTHDGCLALEVGTPRQAGVVLQQLRGWTSCGIEPDRAGRDRVVWARGPAIPDTSD